jgi:hypothetical protein
MVTWWTNVWIKDKRFPDGQVTLENSNVQVVFKWKSDGLKGFKEKTYWYNTFKK